MMQAPMCSECFTGTIWGDATPTGKEETIHGVPTYVASPDASVTPLATVVIITDAFGWKFRNTRVIADAYAKDVPCTVYVPDFMDGHALPESTIPLLEAKPAPTANLLSRALFKARTTLSLAPLLLRFILHNRQSLAQPRVQAFMTALRSASPTAKIGVAGFCWGGLYTVLLTHDTPQNKVSVDGKEYPLIDCAFTAHPSLLTIPGDIEAVVRPLSVANGDDDEWMGQEKMKQLVEILRGKNKVLGEERHEAVVYCGAAHGFATRGDPEDPLQLERGEKSEQQAVRWFRRWFA